MPDKQINETPAIAPALTSDVLTQTSINVTGHHTLESMLELAPRRVDIRLGDTITVAGDEGTIIRGPRIINFTPYIGRTAEFVVTAAKIVGSANGRVVLRKTNAPAADIQVFVVSTTTFAEYRAVVILPSSDDTYELEVSNPGGTGTDITVLGDAHIEIF